MIFDDFSWFSASGLALRRVTTLTVHRYRGGRDVWGTRGTSGGLQDAPRMPGNPPETKIKILKILKFFIFSKIFGSGGSRQGSTTGNHAWPRGPPAGPRVGTPTTGWPATLPGKPGGSQEAGGSIGAVQGTARAAPGGHFKNSLIFKFLTMKPTWGRPAW